MNRITAAGVQAPTALPPHPMALQDGWAVVAEETLGASPPTGNIVPPGFEYAIKIPADPYDPEKAKKLLAEAGYPKRFYGGDK